MSAPVDVLAVMDDAMSWVGPDEDALREARAAVAELIEADREYDAAMRSEADTDGMLRREAARGRRAAALARIGGSP